jgi:hypothetical protein
MLLISIAVFLICLAESITAIFDYEDAKKSNIGKRKTIWLLVFTLLVLGISVAGIIANLIS